MNKIEKIFRKKEIIKIKNYYVPPDHTPMTDIVFPVIVSITKKELESCKVPMLKKVIILRGNFYLQTRFE